MKYRIKEIKTIRTGNNHSQIAYGISSYCSNSMKSDNPNSGIYEADTSRTLDNNGGNPACNQGGIAVVEAINFSNRPFNAGDTSPVVKTLCANEASKQPGITVCYNDNVQYIVRRLTPLECSRLQGYPDGWCDIGDWIDSNGKKHKESDSVKYKALGNSIALPCWFNVLSKISMYIGENATMASLFDGIGGFPLIWQAINGDGSCLWASEIEEFPIAVTKERIQ